MNGFDTTIENVFTPNEMEYVIHCYKNKLNPAVVFGSSGGNTEVDKQIRDASGYFIPDYNVIVERFKNNDVDFHQTVADMAGIERIQAKTINLGLFYGMGKNKLQAELGVSKDKAEELARNGQNSLFNKIENLSKPVIAAVNGVAAGAGFSFVGFADMAIASSNATFVSAYSKIGLTPDGSSTYFLPRIIGARRHTELVLTNRVLSANEALDWGLINKVVDFKDLKDEAYNLAKKLAEGPSLAFGKLKNLVHNSFSDSLEGQMEYEARMIAESAKTKDGMNGIEAFVNKQPVSFKGQ